MTNQPPPEPKITDLAGLRAHLQVAVGLELTTIPPYLCALYSIKDGHNTAAAQAIRSVVMEEMLHMSLAANVLNAVGEAPSTEPVQLLGEWIEPVPEYPTKVPFITGIGDIRLRPFTAEAVDSFMRIEHPTHENPDAVATATAYSSIGNFYQAIEQALENHAIYSDQQFRDTYREHGDRQAQPNQYYGGAGELNVVSDRASALAAVRRIVAEGEGLPEAALGHTVVDKDKLAYGWLMYSHYARFKEILTGRHYKPEQLVQDTPEGAMLTVDWQAVHPFTTDLPAGPAAQGSELAAQLEFDVLYSELVRDLYTGFANGDPESLKKAVTDMYALRYQAVALMRTPSPGHPGRTLGPRFRYLRELAAFERQRGKAEQLRHAN